jgi:hypothetical protein
VTPELVVDDRRTSGMRGATDHPALLVTLGSRAELARETR